MIVEELFRFIQQAVVVPAEGEQVDLSADSKFQRDLLAMSRQPHSLRRARAEKFLDHVAGVAGGGAQDAEDYGPERLARVGRYVSLRDSVLALSESDVTDAKVNQAVKDEFGSYAGELIKSDDFLTDKKFASDVLVAVKLVTRFDQIDVAAVTAMRQVAAFTEDLAAGRTTTGWHALQLTPPSTAASDTGVAAVSRDTNHMNVWWIGKDETVMVAGWTAGDGWQQPVALPNAIGASTASDVAAVSRDTNHMNVCWIGKDEMVVVAEWSDGTWHDPQPIPGATGASTTSGVAALSRNATHMEVWWIANDGSVRNAWWTDAEGWQVNSTPLAQDASTSSGVAALSRNSTHLEVWWVGKNQSVQGAWWIRGDGWQGPYQVADPGLAAAGGIAAISRTPTQMDVCWLGKEGSVQNSRWTKATGWQPSRQVAAPNSASITGGVAALSLNSSHTQVWWIGEDRSVGEARWTPQGWQEPETVAEANSASASSGVAALSRTPTHMELWWVGKDRSVQDAWWLDLMPPISPADRIRTRLHRPMQFPDVFLPSAQRPALPAQGDEPDPDTQRREKLSAELDSFRNAYDKLVSIPATQLEVRPLPGDDEQQPPGPRVRAARERLAAGDNAFVPAAIPVRMADTDNVLGLSQTVLDAMDSVVKQHLRDQLANPTLTPVEDLVEVVKRRWLDLTQELAPLHTAAPAKVFRLGLNLFAVQEPQPGEAPALLDETPLPDFSHAVTRPIGVGDLQVVRQTLIGYEAADISHIENVLPGELFRRTTMREETTEVTITDETEITRSQERDTQTTERNELVSETQKESTQQSSTTTDQTTTSNYGRLVENGKTNYARNVTDRAVNKLTQTVRQQRVQREKKVFTDEAMHQVDNSTGKAAIRGVYQWVDKKYQVKVLNYGKRLLYDVVVPEPAAYLIDALRKAAQPENFQLSRPNEPAVSKVIWNGGFPHFDWHPLQPQDLNEGNYERYATTYGVTGAVKPPPAEYLRIVAKTDKVYVQDNKINSYGKPDQDKMWYDAFELKIPEGYKAVAGYIATTDAFIIQDSEFPDPLFDFWVGKTPVTFGLSSPYRLPFKLSGQIGSIPCQLLVWPAINQFSYGISVTCQRDAAYKKWQLETHATIIAGYQRQWTNYLGELTKFQAAVRAQMAMRQGLRNDSAIERQELKKAIVHLLMAEHFSNVYYPTPDPTAFPPNPVYVKKWGAVTSFFERAFEWEHLMYIYYPYFWGRKARWGELIAIEDLDPEFEAFLKAGGARVVVPVRPGFEGALAHYHETGDVWMGEEIPDMYSKQYASIIAEIKARNTDPGKEECVEQWEVRLPTTLVVARDDNELPKWTPAPCLQHPDE